MAESNIVFDRLYMDLSQEERDKMTPIQLEDYTTKLPDRKKQVLADLEREINLANVGLESIKDGIKDFWRFRARGLPGRDTLYGPPEKLESLIQRRAQLAELLVGLESQHDWLTGSEF